MSRYIDADALIVNMRGAFIDHVEEFRAVTIIKDAPSIDIVRCGECKYKQQCHKAVEHTTYEPTSVTIGYKSVDFCSYGERREP